MNDYNWLLSTIAQSSAALVGISSGFMILRISLHLSDIANIRNNMEIFRLKYHGQTDQVERFELFKRLQSDLERRRVFPKRLYFGLSGILLLFIVGIIVPVYLIPNHTLSVFVEFILKFSFVFCLMLKCSRLNGTIPDF